MNTNKVHNAAHYQRNEDLLRSFDIVVKSLFIFLAFGLIFVTAPENFAQGKKMKPKPVALKTKTVSNLPKVTKIDAEELKNLLKPKGKPLLISFWATWCDPCREEFPDLIKIGADYKDKIDLITISLDELSEVDNDVPKFLAEMKVTTPAYLLKVPDEGEAIAAVSKDWQGGLPFTILFNGKGETIYSKQGKFNTATLRSAIEQIFSDKNGSEKFSKIKN